MAAASLHKFVEHLRQALPPPDEQGRTDGQLLERFLSRRDEAAFATLVRRHGPMVLGVCRRVLGNHHDAEDAFQATFLVLARKARSVVRRGALGSWLYTVAYRSALEALAPIRRRREVQTMPQHVVAPAEPQDWRPLLDRELNCLAEKYRTPVVLCDLGGLTRRDAARQLKLPEGTLSSRLATARRKLARRLAAQGVSLSGGALAVALSEGVASAHVPMSLVWSTAKTATLVAEVSTPVALLAKGVMKAMFMAKLKTVVTTIVLVTALGVSGLACYTTVGQAAPPNNAPNELEELRKENELLKLNLRVTLEKIKAQEGELAALKVQAAATAKDRLSYDKSVLLHLSDPFRGKVLRNTADGTFVADVDLDGKLDVLFTQLIASPDPVADATAALKSLQSAKDLEEKRKATQALEEALKKLKEQLK